ncbi:MAG: DUF1150 family protein [Alphaproteobacteria bacterium]
MTQFTKVSVSSDMPMGEMPVLYEQEAYVRADCLNGEHIWSIFDAAGEKVGHANSREMAMAVAFQNDLTVFSVH